MNNTIHIKENPSDPRDIYVIRVDEFYKIGSARNPYARLIQHKISCPYQIELIFRWPEKNARLVEYNLHIMFKKKHVRGEWFRITEDDLTFIETKYGAKRVSVYNIEDYRDAYCDRHANTINY